MFKYLVSKENEYLEIRIKLKNIQMEVKLRCNGYLKIS